LPSSRPNGSVALQPPRDLNQRLDELAVKAPVASLVGIAQIWIPRISF
jgi:hypothetical protein